MSERSLQIRVGALSLVALVLLAGFVLVLGSVSVGAQRTLYIELADSGSILKGAPVKIAGVRAGRVEHVEFLVARDARRSELLPGEAPAVNVRLKVSVDEEMAPAVRKDSEFFVTTQGVLGEKYLEIVPGSLNAPEWTDGAHIRAHDPARMDLLFAKASSILGKIEQALGGMDGPKLGELVGNLIRLTGHLDEVLVANRGRIDAIVQNLESTSADAAVLVRSLREGVGSGENVGAIVQNVRTVSEVFARESGPLAETARRTLGTVDQTVSTVNEVVQKHRPGIEATLENLEPLSAHARSAARDASAITQGIAMGRGTAGQLLVDQEIYDDLKEMLRDLKRHPWKMLWKE